MREVIVVSTCSKREDDRAHFAFKGAYLGQYVNGIEVILPKGVDFECDQTYLMKLGKITFKGEKLEGVLFQYKELPF